MCIRDSYKDVFAEFFVDEETKSIYQCPCGMQNYVFTPDKDWRLFDGEVPQTAALTARKRAEFLEDMWRWEFGDTTLEGNENIERAIDVFYGEEDDEKNYTAVLQSVWNRMNNNGHLLFPIEDLAEGSSESFYRTVSLKDGGRAAAAFTSCAEVKRGQQTSSVSDGIRSVFEKIIDNEELEGVIINPWGKHIYIEKKFLSLLLNWQPDESQ